MFTIAAFVCYAHENSFIIQTGRLHFSADISRSPPIQRPQYATQVYRTMCTAFFLIVTIRNQWFLSRDGCVIWLQSGNSLKTYYRPTYRQTACVMLGRHLFIVCIQLCSTNYLTGTASPTIFYCYYY